MSKKQIIDKIVNDLPMNDMLGKMTKEEWHGWFEECWDKAINYTHCCTQLLCLDDDFYFLTKGKTYKMESEPDGHYVVIDDFGQERLLWQKYFERLN
jgi:hypothetical protein